MRIRYLFVLLALTVVCNKTVALNDTVLVTKGDTLLLICLNTEDQKDSAHIHPPYQCKATNDSASSSSYPDDVSALTLAVNTVNNVLDDMNTLFTVVTILISIITLFVAVVGLFGFHDMKNEIKNYKEEINMELATWKTETDKLKKKNEAIEKVQTLNNQYLQKINQWMLTNAYSYAAADVPGGTSTQGRDLMEKSILNYYLMKFYLSKDRHEIDGCINYIKEKGGEEVIEYLQYVVDNDLDEYKSSRANIAIGYIKGRLASTR